ncbi:Hypothetical predicted protein [Podarcis lilfordi]|uniref:Uncharacterized protein n=1 Tax=Podarcis lilfordi TaxID=74358 RepID=A0AA35JYW5_9SAUR|nr:Hypothetical predicted protein [Podarcis lilfordi]
MASRSQQRALYEIGLTCWEIRRGREQSEDLLSFRIKEFAHLLPCKFPVSQALERRRSLAGLAKNEEENVMDLLRISFWHLVRHPFPV